MARPPSVNAGLSLLLIIFNLVSMLAVNFPMLLGGGGFWSFAANYGRYLIPDTGSRKPEAGQGQR